LEIGKDLAGEWVKPESKFYYYRETCDGEKLNSAESSKCVIDRKVEIRDLDNFSEWIQTQKNCGKNQKSYCDISSSSLRGLFPVPLSVLFTSGRVPLRFSKLGDDVTWLEEVKSRWRNPESYNDSRPPTKPGSTYLWWQPLKGCATSIWPSAITQSNLFSFLFF
jgi:hypothetical protein